MRICASNDRFADITWSGILVSLNIFCYIFITFSLHFCAIFITFVTFRELTSVYDGVGLSLDVLLQYIRR